MKHNEQTDLILTDRFGKDSLIALATVEDGVPHVRTVDAVYIGGAFYVVTYALSGKCKQIAKNPTVAISGEWFTAMASVKTWGMCCCPKTRRLWTFSVQRLPHGTITVIPMKQTPTPAC